MPKTINVPRPADGEVLYDVEEKVPRLVTGRTLSISLGIASFAVIVFGILPNSIYQWALEAAQPFVR